MNKEIKENLYPLYDMYNQYKMLFNFYMAFKDMKNTDDINERIEYIKKNPQMKQKSELETLLWIINEVK